MRRYMLVTATVAALVAAGGACNLVDSKGVHIGYSFDAQHFTENVGDPNQPSQTLPNVACTPGAMPDPCALAASQLPAAYAKDTTVACDAGTKKCAAQTVVRLAQVIDLRNAMTPVPEQAVNLGIDSVAIDRIAYWVVKNSLNVDTPPFDVYVAPQAAKDEHDPKAVKLGSVAPLPAGMTACADPVDQKGDPMAPSGTRVCDMPLTADGQAALGEYIKNYKSAPFQIIVAATVHAAGGMPVPSGTLDFYVRPSVTLSVLK